MSPDPIAVLDRAKEVDVETVSPKGTVHRVPIWVVVIDGVAYIASVRGERGRWYRELTARDGALIVDGKRIAVHAVAVSDPAIRQRVSEAYARKYKSSRASVIAMQRPEALATTLRLEVLG